MNELRSAVAIQTSTDGCREYFLFVSYATIPVPFSIKIRHMDPLLSPSVEEKVIQGELSPVRCTVDPRRRVQRGLSRHTQLSFGQN